MGLKLPSPPQPRQGGLEQALYTEYLFGGRGGIVSHMGSSKVKKEGFHKDNREKQQIESLRTHY